MLSVAEAIRHGDTLLSFTDPVDLGDPGTPLNGSSTLDTPTEKTGRAEEMGRSRASSFASDGSRNLSASTHRRGTRRSRQHVPLEHPDTEVFNSLDKLLETHNTLDATMKRHLRELSGRREAVDVRSQNLGSLESDLNSLTSSFVEMKSLREDFSEPGGMEVRGGRGAEAVILVFYCSSPIISHGKKIIINPNNSLFRSTDPAPPDSHSLDSPDQRPLPYQL